jgi:putative PIN family toxin of toxin-antitoxin system
MPLRVLLDTNIFVSYLLAPGRSSPISQIVRAGYLGAFTLILPQELLAELALEIGRKSYLAHRISPEELEELVATLLAVAEPAPRIEEEIPAVTRDPKDDYLLAYAVVAQADYLVAGDRDLLVLRQVEQLNIVTPREFWRILAGGEPGR